MREQEPIFWPVARLLAAFRARELSPVEVTRQALERVRRFDDQLHSYVTVSDELALEQAQRAEALYLRPQAELPPLLGLPLSIKDLFDVRGEPTSLGSLVYRGRRAEDDSLPVVRLRRAGAVFLGKTNTAEFGQSATTENRLGPGCGNPWDPARTAGGSSGGAAASVGAGLASVALGSDGGGSIRIPAAMCGLFGIKPTLDSAGGEQTFRAMTDFVCAGPIARRVADARLVLSVLLDRDLPAELTGPCRIAWCAAPEGRPVDSGVRSATDHAIALVAELGHHVEEVRLPVDGWTDAFGPLVLADEWRYRRHLLQSSSYGLTDYARRTIEAAERVSDAEIGAARELKDEIRERVESLFERYDLLMTPTTACVAFKIGERPTEIDGRSVSGLWGAFPFTAPFNVAGVPAASLPVALAAGLPVGLQIIGPSGGESRILDICEQLESAMPFPAGELAARWHSAGGTGSRRATAAQDGALVIEHEEGVVVLRIDRPEKRNALTSGMLERIREALWQEAGSGARTVILTGSDTVFSSGMDLKEIGNGSADLEVDAAIAATSAAIRELPIPVIAAIEGPCLGAAVEISVACDLRIAGAGASFAIPAARLGVLYRPHAIADLVGSLGRDTAARLLVLGDLLSAQEAALAGLVSRVVDGGRARSAALELAIRNADASLAAVGAAKQLINHVAARSANDLDRWDAIRRSLLTSETRRRLLTATRERLSAGATAERGAE